jgi:hypothetical protein
MTLHRILVQVVLPVVFYRRPGQGLTPGIDRAI